MFESTGIPEEWRPVVGYETHYEVSNLGRVRRTLQSRGTRAGRFLSISFNDGYAYVPLSRFDKKRKIGVHVLVAEAFHGKRPRRKMPNHKDLNRSNNLADNLEWLTNRQNTIHAIQAGRKPGRPMPGAENGRAKLTEDQVRVIRVLKGRVGQRELAVLCGVSKSAIQFIHQGKHWRETKVVA